MVQFRPQSREIIAKIVYYGPPLGGKTTNLRTLYSGYPTNTRGELVVVPTGGDRTIFFDFLPIYAGELRGMQLRVQLYTVPGQVHYNSTRQVVLRGVDGVVFVADSQREMLRNNRESWENLKDNLLLQGISLSDMPHVLQYNKRDLQDVVDIGDLDQFLNEFNAPFYEAVATTGIGVEETLQGVVKLVVRSLRDRFRVPADSPPLRREAAPPPRPIVPPPVSPAEAVTKPLRQPGPAVASDAKVFSFSSPAVVPEAAPAPPPATPVPAAPVAAVPPPSPFDEPPSAGLGDAFSFAPPPEPPPVWPTPAGFGDPDPEPEPAPAPPPTVEPPVTPETIRGPAAAFTEPDAASLIARVFGRPLDRPVVSPVVLAASAAQSELPPIDLPVAPPEPPRSPFDSGPAEFEPSPAFDTIEPLPAELEPPVEFAAARLLPEPAAMEPPLAVAPPTAKPEPAEQATAAAPAPEPEPERWAVQEPMRITELPAPPAEIEPEFTAPGIPAFGEPVAAFAEPEMSPFSEPPIPAFADLGDPFLLADAAFEAPAAAAPSAEPGDVFAAEPAAQAEPVAEAPVATEPEAEAPARVETYAEVQAAPEPMLTVPVAFLEPPAPADVDGVAVEPVVEPPAEPAFFAAPTVEVAATASETVPPAAGEQPSPEAVAEAERAAGAAIQRVIPRALAQYGEVRELELEVPVPSVWVGGKRMTLQLRLTLVPQEEEPGD
jgi:signal recognition particle receptor subunit beta